MVLSDDTVSMMLWASSKINILLKRDMPTEDLVASQRIVWYGVTIMSASEAAFLAEKYPHIYIRFAKLPNSSISIGL